MKQAFLLQLALLLFYGVAAGKGLLAGQEVSGAAGCEAESAESKVSNAKGDVSLGWTAPAAGSRNSLGALYISAKSNGASVALALTVTPAGAPLGYLGMECAEGEFRLRFESGSRTVLAVLRPDWQATRIALDISAPDLSVAVLSVSNWPAEAHAETISVPYYSGRIVYSEPLELFAGVYFDWKGSNATKFDRGAAVYGKLTSGQRNSLHERVVLSAARQIAKVFPDIPNPKSPYMESLSGRTVIDIGGAETFAEITGALKRLGEYGLRDCVLIVHDWQRSGYDNALPDHYPANANKGGDAGLSDMTAAAKDLGCLMALHENYVDDYPNSDHFTLDGVALTSDGKPQNAWLNRTTHVQSYATKAAWFLKNAATQAPEIHRRYGTNASFVDVNSAVLPWWRADMDATTGGAGTFAAMDSASRDLWKFERRAHEGPVFGEGLNHWYWSGLLDGVEAQFGAGGTAAKGPDAPLFADFDLVKIHPLQINQGMGFYERWTTASEELHRQKPADAYRMQEIVFGHAPYIAGDLWRNARAVLEEQNLVSPVARRYATQSVESIQYEVGGNWTGSDAAVKARDWSRIQVRYVNGDTIVANSRAENLAFDGYELPQYGWLARGKGLLAFLAIRNGHAVTYSETGTSYFANARGTTRDEGVTDFGVVRTNGMVSLVREAGAWVMRVFPASGAVQVELDSRALGNAQASNCKESAEPVPKSSEHRNFVSFRFSGAAVCRWPAG